MMKQVIFGVLLATFATVTNAQTDSTYVGRYEDDFMARVFLARRFTNFNFRNDKNDLSVRYSPNSGFALGVGANYKWATLNLSYAFEFMNPYRDRGETRALDFQLHGYGQKIVIDLLGQFYEGFYLPKRAIRSASGSFYTRPDVHVNAVGGTMQYVFNNKRFSYRASFMQNQVQRRSAGTFLAGMEVYVGRVAGDSSLVPALLAEHPVKVRSMDFLEVGPNIGYAYTWVYKEKFFLSGSASVSINAGYNRYGDGKENTSVVNISPNSLFRVSGGYNTEKWAFSIVYIATGLYLPGGGDNDIVVNSGDVRMNVNRRFAPSKKMRKYLRPVDKAADEVNSILDGDKKRDRKDKK